jgi:hypothetical protein
MIIPGPDHEIVRPARLRGSQVHRHPVLAQGQLRGRQRLRDEQLEVRAEDVKPAARGVALRSGTGQDIIDRHGGLAGGLIISHFFATVKR